MIEALPLGFGEFTKVDVRGKHRVPSIGKVVCEPFDRGCQPPIGVQE